MPVYIQVLNSEDGAILDAVADGVFDHAIDPQWTRAFFSDPRHHLVVAIEDGVVVGMASGVDYVHPDKAPQLWVNELGVAPSHRRRGTGRALLQALLAHGRTLGCKEAWLGTEEDNEAARGLYEQMGSKPEPFVLYSFDIAGEPDSST